jgi:hypothetical protein
VDAETEEDGSTIPNTAREFRTATKEQRKNLTVRAPMTRLSRASNSVDEPIKAGRI